MMKIIPLFLVTVFLPLLLNVTYAQDDVNSLLISGDTKQVKQAARMMARGQQSTPENLRLLAGIIEQEFKSSPSNRIDALSWGCRALGATGDGQYKPLLQKIYQSSRAHKKLKRYAKKAYHELLSAEQVVAKKNLFALGLIPKASLTKTERKIFAIAKGDWQAIKFITQTLGGINETGKFDTQLLDALSQFLIEMHLYNLNNDKTDTLALICRKLGQSQKGRYKSILQSVANKATNKKLRNDAIFASSSLFQTSSSYIVGSVNFQRILNEFKLK